MSCRAILSVLGALLLFAPLQAVAAARGSENGSHLEFSVPLENGRLHLRDVFEQACERLGMEAGDALQHLEWSIDVTSTLGRLQLHALNRCTDGVLEATVRDDAAVVRVDRKALGALLNRGAQQAEQWLAEAIGRDQQDGAEAMTYRLNFVTPTVARLPIADLPDPPQRVIVLIHGLDDPGFMWRDLIPHLHEHGYAVARFEYPNDTFISDATDLFAIALAQLREIGVQRVDIIAHSMGGLVTRDLLTRPAYYNGDGTGWTSPMGADQLPAVDRLIMLGTPNHGSHLARLRSVTELREHIYRSIRGDGSLLDALRDGWGEAGSDLLPGSAFLRRLNARPLATHTRHTVVAGQISPVDGDDISAIASRIRRLANMPNAPQWLQNALADQSVEQRAAKLLARAVDGLGDGCVTLESAKLEGVDDFEVVTANHLSMIVNYGFSTDTPPAIPIILQRLSE